ncbi:MAG: sn-glycerol-3-phosphate ABC transporter ATP-binding protein UgpC [Clostridia bacterium]|nr:sn-glycerol-3-phosphate ABC transporter ATP-binding protein UgpC [Clostridia bacterium]
MASLSLRHVYKVYPNGKKAVSDFSMEIADKEFIVFVGPSGCGKSTTLRMIAGLEEITTGEVYIDGTLVNDMEPKDRDIAMVFQNYALYPHISVYENMAFGLKIRKLPKEEIHRRVIEAAEILGITEYLDKKPKEMSGGQRQRVALGRAIVREPKVFLLDEPLSNLDAKLRTEMRGQISKLHAKLKTTFIYVTHDQTEAMTMGTRIVVMKDGVVRQVDTPTRLYSAPQSKFVASFIGSPPMNFYRVTLGKGAQERVTVRFRDAELMWEIPASLLRKARPEYLDGKHGIVLGIRAERVHPVKEGAKNAPEAIAHCRVSHVEELGDEALVYGDLSGEAERVTASRTEIVFRVDAETGVHTRAGDVIALAFDLRFAHFFDEESEETICPEIPENNVLPVTSDGEMMTVAGERFPLPPALRGRVKGTLTAEIPIRALRPAGARGSLASAEIVHTECIGERVLTTLRLGNRTVFAEGAFGKEGQKVWVAPDYRLITFFDGEKRVLEALNEKSRLYGRIVRETVVHEETDARGRTRKRKGVRYSFEIAGVRCEIPDVLLAKLLKIAGTRVLRKDLRYEIPADAVTVGEGEHVGSVLADLDYGADAHYARLSVGGREVIAKVDRKWEGNVRFSLDLDRLGYIDDALDVILM